MIALGADGHAVKLSSEEEAAAPLDVSDTTKFWGASGDQSATAKASEAAMDAQYTAMLARFLGRMEGWWSRYLMDEQSELKLALQYPGVAAPQPLPDGTGWHQKNWFYGDRPEDDFKPKLLDYGPITRATYNQLPNTVIFIHDDMMLVTVIDSREAKKIISGGEAMFLIPSPFPQDDARDWGSALMAWPPVEPRPADPESTRFHFGEIDHSTEVPGNYRQRLISLYSPATLQLLSASSIFERDRVPPDSKSLPNLLFEDVLGWPGTEEVMNATFEPSAPTPVLFEPPVLSGEAVGERRVFFFENGCAIVKPIVWPLTGKSEITWLSRVGSVLRTMTASRVDGVLHSVRFARFVKP